MASAPSANGTLSSTKLGEVGEQSLLASDETISAIRRSPVSAIPNLYLYTDNWGCLDILINAMQF
jgi:hypothetical protein